MVQGRSALWTSSVILRSFCGSGEPQTALKENRARSLRHRQISKACQLQSEPLAATHAEIGLAWYELSTLSAETTALLHQSVT